MGLTELKILCCCYLSLVSKLCPPLCNPMDYRLPGSPVHGISQARILEWACHSLLQGIVPTQGSNPSLPHWQAGSLPLSCQGSPPTSFMSSNNQSVFTFCLLMPISALWFCSNQYQNEFHTVYLMSYLLSLIDAHPLLLS